MTSQVQHISATGHILDVSLTNNGHACVQHDLAM